MPSSHFFFFFYFFFQFVLVEEGLHEVNNGEYRSGKKQNKAHPNPMKLTKHENWITLEFID